MLVYTLARPAVWVSACNDRGTQGELLLPDFSPPLTHESTGEEQPPTSTSGADSCSHSTVDDDEDDDGNTCFTCIICDGDEVYLLNP